MTGKYCEWSFLGSTLDQRRQARTRKRQLEDARGEANRWMVEPILGEALAQPSPVLAPRHRILLDLRQRRMADRRWETTVVGRRRRSPGGGRFAPRRAFGRRCDRPRIAQAKTILSDGARQNRVRSSLERKSEDNLTESRLDCRDNYGDLNKSRSLRGSYTRVLSNMVVILTGRCLVNDFATGQVTFIANIQGVPGDPVPDDPSGGEGITRSVTTLNTTGTFTLVPV